MKCDELREQLPDYALGSLSEIETHAVRAHLRGCSGCRRDAVALDEGLAMFSNAAHDAAPPPALKERVMDVLSDEWSETPVPVRPSTTPRLRRWPALAAALVLVAGALSWGAFAQVHASRSARDAASYRQFLHALGGRDVRVGVLQSRTSTPVDGTAVLYDSDLGQSWALVLVRAPGYTGDVRVTLVSPRHQTIAMHPIQLDAEGEGSTWLVTSVNLTSFDVVQVSSTDGRVLALTTTRD